MPNTLSKKVCLTVKPVSSHLSIPIVYSVGIKGRPSYILQEFIPEAKKIDGAYDTFSRLICKFQVGLHKYRKDTK